MKVCLLHNAYVALGGEDIAVATLRDLLERRGHKVVALARRSADIPRRRLGRARAFWTGIYSGRARRAMRRLLDKERPDIVHVHNLFPLISPAVLPECRKVDVPVVMTVHNFRLICPNGLHMVRGQVCERCAGGREYWCVLRNCEGDLLKSLGYAVRSFVARKARFFLDNIAIYMALSRFQRERLIAAGFPGDRIRVVPNPADDGALADDLPPGRCVGYVGRISPEKGLTTLQAAARRCPDIPFEVAGDAGAMPEAVNLAPPNVLLRGFLGGQALQDFYARCRFVVVPSTCFEGFPGAIVEAMQRGRAVVCSRIGGLPEIVEEGRTGLLFEPGDAEDLAAKVRRLWDRPDLCGAMGRAGRAKAAREYTPDRYYERLLAVYREAVALGQSGARVCGEPA